LRRFKRSTRERSRNMARRVYVDEDECIGCGTCEEICEEVFKLNEETDKAEVIQPEGGPEELIQEAIDSCPVECIHWEE
jgi:ferredoxin